MIDNNKREPLSFLLYLHIPGGLPSGRELIDLISIIECSLAWTPIALAHEKRYKADTKSWKFSDKDSDKARIERDVWNSLLNPIDKSYSDFLSNKYSKMLLEVTSPSWTPSLSGDFHDFYRSLDKREREQILNNLIEIQQMLPERKIQNALSKRSFTGEDFNIIDFGEWISIDIGRDLLITKDISLKNSIELLFDVAAVTFIVSAQDFPIFKDIVVYFVGILRGYIGTTKIPVTPNGMKPPKITPSMIRSLAQFREAELHWKEGDKEMHIILKK